YHIVLAIMVVLSAALLLYFSGCPFGKMRGGAAIDSNLEAALREHLGKRWGALTVEDWAGLKKVEFPGCSIERLAGFEHAVNLRELNLRNNEIEDPAPLGELPRLKYLNLADNKIKDISGLNGAVLNGLAHLDVSINRIDDLSALDWDELKALTHLDIRYNYIDLQDREVAELLSDLRSRGVNVLSEPMY
ncbi:MAG: leucine-rich repeat domain-containing protein, partial [Firmicutes bacterium]|nr:leucine-rich repeat domain-containing protein [Bacillota bacterium]